MCSYSACTATTNGRPWEACTMTWCREPSDTSISTLRQRCRRRIRGRRPLPPPPPLPHLLRHPRFRRRRLHRPASGLC